jgi:cell wall-associated NlpC family hydrolase
MGRGRGVSPRLVSAGVAPVWRASTGSDRDDRVTETLAGEPVLTTGVELDGRAEVVVPWQPSSLDPAGYPGWVALDHLATETAGTPDLHVPDGTFPADLDDPVDLARTLLGTPYVWGGLNAGGIDCSGLVHLVHRSMGIVVPRDASDQAAALLPVPVDEVRRGDLYFFARDDKPVHHVALVVEPGVMLHASSSDGMVVEASLEGSGRTTSVVTAARVDPRPTMTR